MADDSLIKKLRLTTAQKIAIVNPPDGYLGKLDNPPADGELKGEYDFVQVFVTKKSEVDALSESILRSVRDDGIFWFTFPKKSSALSADVTRDSGWETLTDAGMQGVSLVSVDDDWSAFRLKKGQTAERKDQISDQAVKDKTGKNWQGWFVALNQRKGKELSHKEIVKVLRDDFNVDPWWAQMITNTYEKYIDRREKHQKAGGFEVGASKTMNVDIGTLYNAWINNSGSWLDHEFEVTKSTENRSIRIKWADETRVSVEFYAKGEAKSSVSIQHLKLPDLDIAEKQKAWWKEKLEVLKSYLEAN